MDIGSSDSRQPPDGHEFPDYIETEKRPSWQPPISSNHVFHEKKTITKPTFTSIECDKTCEHNFPKTKPSNLILEKTISTSNCDLRPKMYESDDENKFENSLTEKTNLHTRSQSLIDMSIFSKEKNNKWNCIVEQRRKGLSKLKGLVIPEQNENDICPSVNIPEIKSYTPIIMPVSKLDGNFNNNNCSQVFLTSNEKDYVKPSVLLPSWTTSTTIPKYSPAFKRKSLQVYSFNQKKPEQYFTNNYITNSKPIKVNEDELNPPKSLESIASPTRSDCSFDYVSFKKYQKDHCDTFNNVQQNTHRDIHKLEDESDNDSAVSSSQSSYNSRCSPPPSPTRSCDIDNFKKYDSDDKLNTHNRLLKPSSVEAINRKNILASAKCRSGKDIKIGSPVIQRKHEEEQINGVKKVEQIIVHSNGKKSIEENCHSSHENGTNGTEVIVLKIKTSTVVKCDSKYAKVPQDNLTSKPPIPVIIKPSTVEIQENIMSLTDKFSASNILSKRIKPVNVKALKENFENSGSSTLPLYPKVTNGTHTIKKYTNVENNQVKNKIRETEVTVKKIESSKESFMSSLKKVKEVINEKPIIKNVELNLDHLGGSLGITLAGGADYENKDITVHRIRFGSVAYQDGRLKKGDKILSVNGKSTATLTHLEAVDLLKEPCIKYSIEVEESKEENVPSYKTRRPSVLVTSGSKGPNQDVKILKKEPTHVVIFVKDGAGLGFSIEGGKDSPKGDVPLVVKKIFTGGAADKNGELQVGDEIIYINEINFTNLSRIEAWTLMKKIPDGSVKIQFCR